MGPIVRPPKTRPFVEPDRRIKKGRRTQKEPRKALLGGPVFYLFQQLGPSPQPTLRGQHRHPSDVHRVPLLHRRDRPHHHASGQSYPNRSFLHASPDLYGRRSCCREPSMGVKVLELDERAIQQVSNRSAIVDRSTTNLDLPCPHFSVLPAALLHVLRDSTSHCRHPGVLDPSIKFLQRQLALHAMPLLPVANLPNQHR